VPLARADLVPEITITADGSIGIRSGPTTTISSKPAKAIPDGWLPDTPEEHKRRGDAADALFRELMRRVAAAEA
jgi:hypothetical protein